jgi:hypothetical protein
MVDRQSITNCLNASISDAILSDTSFHSDSATSSATVGDANERIAIVEQQDVHVNNDTASTAQQLIPTDNNILGEFEEHAFLLHDDNETTTSSYSRTNDRLYMDAQCQHAKESIHADMANRLNDVQVRQTYNCNYYVLSSSMANLTPFYLCSPTSIHTTLSIS